jgi:hypothetical protein
MMAPPAPTPAPPMQLAGHRNCVNMVAVGDVQIIEIIGFW